jgi:UDP-glucose 4-epimerase
MRILITGGAGFIGSHLVEHFQGKASEIRVLDNLRSGYRKNLDGLDHTFIEGSITDPQVVEEAVSGVDWVFNLAALVSVPESMERPFETVNINVKGLLNVLDSASRLGVKKVIHASSAAVYGDNPTVPKTEDMLPEPKSPYAITKLDGEYYLNLHRHPGVLDTCSFRFFNVFGPRQDPNGAYAAAVPIFIERALAAQPITVFGDGEQTRDFIYVKDIVSALVFGAEKSLSGTFNVGYGRQMTINDLAKRIITLTDSPSEIRHLAERPGDVKHSRASVEKLFAAGWQPAHTMDEALAATITLMRS